MSLFLGRVEKRLQTTFGEPPVMPWSQMGTAGYGPGAGMEPALMVPTVWACVMLLSNAVSMLPLEGYRRQTSGIPTLVTDVPLLTVPAADTTPSAWLHMLMMSLLLRGNAYGKIVNRDEQTQLPTQIELLHPDKVKVEADKVTGLARYTMGVNNTDVTSSIWHMRGLTWPGSIVGLSPVAHAAATIGVDLSSRDFAQDFFNGGGIPKAVLETPQPVSQDQARTLKDRLLAATRNREPLVLSNGVKYQAISVKPEESQFLATQQANVSQVARYFGPTLPAMVGGNEGTSMTYVNREQRAVDFLTYDVGWWLKRIEDAIFPLLPPMMYATFNTGALLRTDAETQAKVDNMQLAGKTRVPSEFRQRDGLPPMTPEQKAEADMIPLTITPLGGVKALPGLKAASGPVAPVPANDQEPANA